MDIKDVENLASLARIELTEDEKNDLLSDMESILGYIKQIERPAADVDDFEANQNVTNVWREDVLVDENSSQASKFSKELIIGQFPDKQDGFLKVKKIL
jgi:aspartyl-tRNA(Asn)/glutamyl-tRNA(Gln) amidotransferase subunit C